MEESALRSIMNSDLLRIIAGLAVEFQVDAYLVGGALRDTLMGRETNDLDFALSGAWEEIPRALAERTTGSFFWLDEKRGQSRVVKKGGDGISACDFAPFCGSSIREDLLKRDFTINALAMPISGNRCELVDPLHGYEDLRRRVIRACSATSLEDDPLRLLRAIRFAGELGFVIEENSWESICAKAPLLQLVAAERVRDELFRTLALPGTGASLRRLCESGLWAEILPAPEWAICEGSIARAEETEHLCIGIDRLFPEGAERLADYLRREVEARVTVGSLIKLAALLGSSEKDGSVTLAERLRLGKTSGRMLDFFRRDEFSLFRYLERDPTERAIHRFFRDREHAGLGMIIIARASGILSDASFSRLLGQWSRINEGETGDLFLTGGEVMEILSVSSGRAVGEAMERLREAEGNGRVNSREEAMEFIKNLLTKVEPMR